MVPRGGSPPGEDNAADQPRICLVASAAERGAGDGRRRRPGGREDSAAPRRADAGSLLPRRRRKCAVAGCTLGRQESCEAAVVLPELKRASFRVLPWPPSPPSMAALGGFRRAGPPL